MRTDYSNKFLVRLYKYDILVSASDEDADNNGAIVYTLSAPYNPADIEYFEIQPESGWIVLKKPLDVSMLTGWSTVWIVISMMSERVTTNIWWMSAT